MNKKYKVILLKKLMYGKYPKTVSTGEEYYFDSYKEAYSYGKSWKKNKLQVTKTEAFKCDYLIETVELSDSEIKELKTTETIETTNTVTEILSNNEDTEFIENASEVISEISNEPSEFTQEYLDSLKLTELKELYESKFSEKCTYRKKSEIIEKLLQ